MNPAAPIDVKAWEASDPVVLTSDQIATIRSSRLGEVLAVGDEGHVVVKASQNIGLVVGDDWELRVMPRLDVPRLMFLLGYATGDGWNDAIAGFEDDDDLFSAIANAFGFHATCAIERGVIRGYVHRDEREIALRGRIRFGDQIARSGGLPIPVEISYDDFTEDVLENRMLRTAASLLLRLPRIPKRTRLRLLRLRSILAEVSEVAVGVTTKAPPITRLNKRYESALVLAELILSSASIDANRDTTRATTFVFDMNRVFEDFVTVALGDALRPFGGELVSQVTEMKLSQHIPLKPDLAWRRAGRWEAVLDVKYKPLYSDSFPNGDAYQMLAYTLAYGLDEGWLVYAREPDRETRIHEIPTAGKRLIVTALDVTLEPDALLAEVDVLAARIASSRPVALAA